MKQLACLLVLLSIGSLALWGQADANKGQIIGTVLDPNQAVIPNAKVTIRNPATGFVRELTTGAEGQFRAVLLDPGTYDVSVETSGFAPATAKGVVVNVGSAVDLPIVLQIGTTTQTVEVSTTRVEVSMPEPTSIINSQQIHDLPINGRRFQDFALLTPTVQVDPVRGQLSFVGQRGINSNIAVDGADYNNPFFGGIRGGERSNFVITVPQSSIQEFQVITEGYSAEYGRSTGGILNAITKSGTNSYHGEGFFQIRPREAALENPLKAPTLETLKQFGGGVGGPIKRDKLFFFAAAERQLSDTPRQIKFAALATFTPTAATTEAFNYFKSLEGPLATTNNATAVTGRADYSFANGSRLTARYNYSDATAQNAVTTGNTLPSFIPEAFSNQGNELDTTHTGVAELTSVLGPRIVNELRFSATYELRPRTANSLTPTVGASPVGSFGARSFLPNVEDDYRIQVNDSLSLIRGLHTFKFGFDYNYSTASQAFGFNQFGAFSFGTQDVNTILTSLGTTQNRFDTPLATYRREIGNLLASLSIQQIAFYAQDSWRVNPRVMLDYGVRWEGQINPTPEANNSAVIQAVQGIRFPIGMKLDPTKIPNTLDQWGPRMGITIRPFDNDRTVLRGFAGIFYAAAPLILFAGPVNNFRLPPGDVFIQLPTLGSTVYKDLLRVGVDLNKSTLDKLPIVTIQQVQQAATVAGNAPDPFRGAGFLAMANDFRNPRAVQAGFGFEHEAFRNFVVSGQFSFVNTVHLERNRDYNLPAPYGVDAAGRPLFGVQNQPAGAPRVPRPLSQNTGITVRDSSARSMYRAGTATARYRFSKFQFTGTYTLSQTYSNDDNERDASGFTYDNPFNFTQNYGFSNLDVRHQLSTNAIAFLPFGIELSGTYRFRSGLPIDPLAGSDLNQDGSNSDRAYRAPGVPFPRNYFRNKHFQNMDLRVLKIFKFADRYQLEFSVEMFNLPNFDNVVIGPATGNTRNLQYGPGVSSTTGALVAPNVTFGRLRLADGSYDPVNSQLGNPFQAQFGARFIF